MQVKLKHQFLFKTCLLCSVFACRHFFFIFFLGTETSLLSTAICITPNCNTFFMCFWSIAFSILQPFHQFCKALKIQKKEYVAVHRLFCPIPKNCSTIQSFSNFVCSLCSRAHFAWMSVKHVPQTKTSNNEIERKSKKNPWRHIESWVISTCYKWHTSKKNGIFNYKKNEKKNRKRLILLHQREIVHTAAEPIFIYTNRAGEMSEVEKFQMTKCSVKGKHIFFFTLQPNQQHFISYGNDCRSCVYHTCSVCVYTAVDFECLMGDVNFVHDGAPQTEYFQQTTSILLEL